MQSAWENEGSLGDLFVTRKCFAYTRDSKGRTAEGREAPELMDAALARVEATYQNIDSFEVGITDVDHYFEYLGGISKAVETRSQSRPAIYLSDSLSPQTKIRSLEEHERGYWNPNEEVLEKLREIVAALDVKVNRATV